MIGPYYKQVTASLMFPCAAVEKEGYMKTFYLSIFHRYTAKLM